MSDEAIALVRTFQHCAGQPVASKPVMADADRVKTRIKWITDGLEEYREAETIYEQADALIDTLYYLLGAFVDSGINADRLFEIVAIYFSGHATHHATREIKLFFRRYGL